MRWTQEEDSALREMADAGMSRKQAAIKLGRTLGSVRYRACVLNANFHSKKGGYGRRADWEEARRLAAKGCWLNEGARCLGVDRSTALYISRRMGFKWGTAPPGGSRCAQAYRKPIGRHGESYDLVNRMMRLARSLRKRV
jgi:hypothetical protein